MLRSRRREEKKALFDATTFSPLIARQLLAPRQTDVVPWPQGSGALGAASLVNGMAVWRGARFQRLA